MAVVGTGITITVGSIYTGFLAEITDVTPPSPSRESLDTSHQGTTNWKTFTPAKLADAGELKVDMWFDPEQDIPINGATDSITINFPGGGSWAFDGFLTNYEAGAQLENLMTASATFKVSGDISVSN